MLRLPRRSRRVLLIFAVLSGLAAGSASHAQTTLKGSLGVSAFTVVGGEAPGDRSPFLFPTAGFTVQRPLPLPGDLSVEISLFYVGKGATSEGTITVEDTAGNLATIDATTELRLAYLDLPILLRTDLSVAPGADLALFGGVAFEFLLDEGIDIITDDGATTGVLTTDNFAGTSFAGQIGAAAVFERFEVQVRYHRSLGDVTSDEAEFAFQDLRHSGVLLSLGYRL